MNIKEIIKFAEECGYNGATYLNEWRGHSCYEPTFADEGTFYVGLPLIIMVKGDEIRMSTPEESLQHVDEFEE